MTASDRLRVRVLFAVLLLLIVALVYTHVRPFLEETSGDRWHRHQSMVLNARFVTVYVDGKELEIRHPKAVSALVHAISLVPKDLPCGCGLHGQGIIFTSDSGILRTDMCGHCLDVVTCRGRKEGWYRMPPDLWKAFETYTKRIAGEQAAASNPSDGSPAAGDAEGRGER